MKFISLSRRAGVLVFLLGFVSTAFVSVAIWRAKAGPDPNPGSSEANHEFLERVRSGVGSQVHFAAMGDSSESVTASVESVAGFIYRRSGMKMSDETKNRVSRDESEALSGKPLRIGITELADVCTAMVISRLAKLSDQEIELTANSLVDTQDAVLLRASGKWGMFLKADFIEQLKQARKLSRDEAQSLRATVSALVKSEFENRAAYLSQALPQQFANLEADGVTPLQALLIIYSVAADDPLTDSQDDLTRQVIQRRMNARQSRPTKGQMSGANKPYGAQGLIFASPLGLLLDQTLVSAVLNQIEGGDGK
jgi:hypothetical protein